MEYNTYIDIYISKWRVTWISLRLTCSSVVWRIWPHSLTLILYILLSILDFQPLGINICEDMLFVEMRICCIKSGTFNIYIQIERITAKMCISLW
jgi:hypothetical protein